MIITGSILVMYSQCSQGIQILIKYFIHISTFWKKMNPWHKITCNYDFHSLKPLCVYRGLLKIKWVSEDYKYPIITTSHENDRKDIEMSMILSIFSPRVRNHRIFKCTLVCQPLLYLTCALPMYLFFIFLKCVSCTTYK